MTTARPIDRGATECDRPPTTEGVCVLCGVTGVGAEVSVVLSDNFLSVERLPFRHHRPNVLCPACTWSFRWRPLRQTPTEWTATGVTVLDPPALLAALSRPIDGDRSVCVPVQGRKHLVPWMRWGVLLTDTGEQPWGSEDCERLEAVRWLRGLGFGEGALREHSPRWVVLSKVDRPADVLTAWRLLDRWREDQTIEVAIRATRKPKEAHGDDE